MMEVRILGVAVSSAWSLYSSTYLSSPRIVIVFKPLKVVNKRFQNGLAITLFLSSTLVVLHIDS